MKCKFNNTKKNINSEYGAVVKKKQTKKSKCHGVEEGIDTGRLPQTEDTQQFLATHDWMDPGQEKTEL